MGLIRKIIIILMLVMLCSCTSKEGETAPEDIFSTPTEEPIAVQDVVNYGVVPNEDEIPVTRAMAAKMIAIAFNEINAIDFTEREISFDDTSVEDWYDKYINIVYLQGFMSGSGSSFFPEDNLTVQQAQYLINKIDPNNKIKLEISNPDVPVSYALWLELFMKALENAAGDKDVREVYGISEETIVTLATSGNNALLREFYIITENGPMTSAGINMDIYIDREVRGLVKDGEIIAVMEVSSYTPTIRNAYIAGHTRDTVTIFVGGAERTYKYRNDFEGYTGYVCDITIDSEEAVELSIYTEKITGVIKRADTDAIELEGADGEYITLPVNADVKIYSIADGSPRWRSMENLIVGTDIAEYVIENGEVLACIITKNAVPGKIRVAINTTSFTSLVHDSVSVTGTGSFNILAGDDIHAYEAWENVNIPHDLYGQQRIYVVPESGKLVITSIKRNWTNNESPQYRGVIEIAMEDNGFSIVNEVSFEEYLYAVVPSEMPSSHGLEAARVQAVTARSYAYNQYFANRYYKFGANIDDSVNSQVYNNIPENEISITAVDDTHGQCLVYGGSVISANFFSTSAGVTANSGEVWSNSATRQFPTTTAAYLRSVKQYEGHDYGNLSVEENAAAFFKSLDVKGFDSSFNWFRWNVKLTAEEITASINANLATRYQANPNLIKTLQEDGSYRSRPITEIGTVKDIEVLRRGEGGNIMSLKITDGETEIIVDTEYNIRMLIRPYQYVSGRNDILLNRSDGSKVNNYWMMPSAFYVIEKHTDESGNMDGVTLHGGGNGHGVGMSQNGVKGMIDAGYAFEEILQHYYNGTEVKKMY